MSLFLVVNLIDKSYRQFCDIFQLNKAFKNMHFTKALIRSRFCYQDWEFPDCYQFNLKDIRQKRSLAL